MQIFWNFGFNLGFQSDKDQRKISFIAEGNQDKDRKQSLNTVLWAAILLRRIAIVVEGMELGSTIYVITIKFISQKCL